MTIRQRGSSFQVDVKVGAKENPTKKAVRVRATSPDETTAKVLEAEIRAAVMRYGKWVPNTPTAPSRQQGTLASALQEAWVHPSGRNRGWKYQKTGKIQYDRAKQCVEFLGPERHCASITTEDYDKLTLHFEKTRNGADTITAKIQSFRRVLWHAERKGWIVRRPLWDRPAPGQPREFVFSPDMEEQTIAYLRNVARNEQMATMFILGIETGMRLGELILTLREHWDTDNRKVLIPAAHAKSGMARTITLTERAVQTVTPWLDACEAGHNRLFYTGRASVSLLMRKAKAALKQGHNKDFCFHATRHTRATRLASITRDPFVVMSQLGHADIKTSMRYIKIAGVPVSVIEGHRFAGIAA